MTAGVHVYVGPSLPVGQAREHLPGATYHPPIAMGDLYALVAGGTPAVVGIIDGYFEQKPAVWHKEIMYALSRGVRVYGASSMGALRAAELDAFGMIGVGEVYQAYASGDIEDDDEVTVAHGPAEDGYRAVSEAMVNIRHGLREARRRGVIGEDAARALERLAKDTFYVDRAWGALWAQAAQAGVAAAEVERLRAFVRTDMPNVKRDDAVALLRRIAADDGDVPAPPPVTFEETSFFRKLQRSVTHAGIPEARDHIWRHANLLPDREDVFRDCLLACFLNAEARARRIQVAPERLTRAKEQFRRRRRLLSGAAMARWMADHHVSEQDLDELARLDVVAEEVVGAFGCTSELFASLLPLELKRRGVLGQIVRDIERKRARRAERGDGAGDADILAALAWYQEARRRITGTLDEHARDLGFASPAELLAEIVADHDLAKER